MNLLVQTWHGKLWLKVEVWIGEQTISNHSSMCHFRTGKSWGSSSPWFWCWLFIAIIGKVHSKWIWKQLYIMKLQCSKDLWDCLHQEGLNLDPEKVKPDLTSVCVCVCPFPSALAHLIESWLPECLYKKQALIVTSWTNPFWCHEDSYPKAAGIHKH